jgi:N-acetylglucosamine-6-phosphate deacetylase
MNTKLIIEQHIHGAFGVDFNKATSEEIVELSKKLLSLGIGGFFPTLVTDSVENTKRQIQVIKQAKSIQPELSAEILGIHLEGIFLNPEKKGIHNSNHFMELTKENYQLLEDDFIKIVTVAPELDVSLLDYLKEKNIKIQAGHCVGGNLEKCSGATHLFNAMQGITHRGSSTSLSALIDDNIYTEVIADGVHLSDESLKLIFKTKPLDKVILISDALPITYSDLKETVFADEVIYYDGIKATSKSGTIAGSTTLVPDIIKRLASHKLFNKMFIENPYTYHNIDIEGSVEWSDEFTPLSIIKNGVKIK